MTTLASRNQSESITKANQGADLLVQDIREAHKAACEANPILGILLEDLIRDAVKIQNRLAEIQNLI